MLVFLGIVMYFLVSNDPKGEKLLLELCSNSVSCSPQTAIINDYVVRTHTLLLKLRV